MYGALKQRDGQSFLTVWAVNVTYPRIGLGRVSQNDSCLSVEECGIDKWCQLSSMSSFVEDDNLWRKECSKVPRASSYRSCSDKTTSSKGVGVEQ